MSVSDAVRHGAPSVIFESYPVVGYNYRMTDMQAAMGREQLKRIPTMVERRRSLASRYNLLLAEVPGVQAPNEPEWARSNWQSYCVRLPTGCDQQEVMQHMLDRGIATRRGIMCAHRENAYFKEVWSCASRTQCECLPTRCEELRESEAAQDNAIILPLFHEMSDEQQSAVVSALHQAIVRSGGMRCDPISAVVK